MSETQRDGSEMRCKRCGANECRIHGFCSVECEHYFDYEEEITDLEARIAELEAENIRLGIEYQRMRLALGDIAINSKRALNESPIDQLTAHSDIERQDDKWIPEVQG